MPYVAGEQRDHFLVRSSLLSGRAEKGTAYVAYAAFGAMMAAGPAILLYAALGAANPTGTMIVGVLVLATLTPYMGILLWSTAKERRRQRELDVGGVPAVAEIIAMGYAGIGDNSGVAFRLRLSGPGFDAFEAEVKCALERGFFVGAVFHALVEPRKGLFTIPR